jgi:hypothetical protein
MAAIFRPPVLLYRKGYAMINLASCILVAVLPQTKLPVLVEYEGTRIEVRGPATKVYNCPGVIKDFGSKPLVAVVDNEYGKRLTFFAY